MTQLVYGWYSDNSISRHLFEIRHLLEVLRYTTNRSRIDHTSLSHG